MNSRQWNKDDINQDLSNISSARYNSGILSQQWQCLVSSILPPNTTIFLYLFILNNMQAIWVFQYSIMVTKFIRHSTFIRQYWNLAFYQGEIFQLFFSSLCPKSTIVDSHKSPKTLRKLHTASLSAVLNHKNVPRLLHTSGTWPDDGRDYNWYTGCCKTSVKLWKHITETLYGVFLVFLGSYDCQLWAIFHFGTLWA